MILTCPNCATRYNADPNKFLQPRRVRCARCAAEWIQEPPQDLPVEVPLAEDMPAAAPQPVPAQAAPEPVYHRTPEPEPEPAYHHHAEPAPDAYEAPAAYAQTAASYAEPSGGYADDYFEQPAAAAAAPAARPRPGFAMPAINWAAIFGWIILIGVLSASGWSVITYRTEIATAWPRASSFYSLIGMPVNISGLEFAEPQIAFQIQDGRRVMAVSGTIRNVSAREVVVPRLRAALKDAEMREIYSWTFDVEGARLKPGEQVNYTTRTAEPPAEASRVSVGPDEMSG